MWWEHKVYSLSTFQLHNSVQLINCSQLSIRPQNFRWLFIFKQKIHILWPNFPHFPILLLLATTTLVSASVSWVLKAYTWVSSQGLSSFSVVVFYLLICSPRFQVRSPITLAVPVSVLKCQGLIFRGDLWPEQKHKMTAGKPASDCLEHIRKWNPSRSLIFLLN